VLAAAMLSPRDARARRSHGRRGRLTLHIRCGGDRKQGAPRSPQTQLVVATKSGHYIQKDEPSLVIDAVQRVVAKATKQIRRRA
jgi:hypothetical protein